MKLFGVYLLIYCHCAGAIADVVQRELLGFKSISFDSSVEQLESMGFLCVTGFEPAYCKARSQALELTFLNQPVLFDGLNELTIFLAPEPASTPDEIHVYVNLSGSEVSAALQESLGSPLTAGGWEYWFFANGASIATYNPLSETYMPAKTLYRSPSDTATSLRSLLPASLKPSINLHDF